VTLVILLFFFGGGKEERFGEAWVCVFFFLEGTRNLGDVARCMRGLIISRKKTSELGGSSPPSSLCFRAWRASTDVYVRGWKGDCDLSCTYHRMLECCLGGTKAPPLSLFFVVSLEDFVLAGHSDDEFCHTCA
jgi:hypothetical protein